MSAAATSGTKAAAFFDLDGTLLPEPSLERRFFSELRRTGAIPFTNYLRWATEAVRLLLRGPIAVQQRNKRYLTGVNGDLAFRHLGSISFFEEGIGRVAWHAQQGHEIVLVSGTLEPLARLAATALECELATRGLEIRLYVFATLLAQMDGHWTGQLTGEAKFGSAKARTAEKFTAARRFDLRDCFAYGNSLLDWHILSAVGHAHVVNPGKEMATLASEKDWPIWHWFQEKQISAAESVRFVSGIQHVEGQA